MIFDYIIRPRPQHVTLKREAPPFAGGLGPLVAVGLRGTRGDLLKGVFLAGGSFTEQLLRFFLTFLEKCLIRRSALRNPP